MDTLNLSQKTEALWKWFEENLILIETVIREDNHPKTQFIIEQLDHHVLDLGRFKWLINSPSDGHFTFTLSPNHKAELYKYSRSIIADAPYYAHWSFFDSIQPSGLAPIEIYDAQMDICEIDPASWRCSLSKEKNGLFDLTIEMNDAALIDPETKEVAATIVITNLLGEAMKIEKIGEISVSDPKAFKTDSASFLIAELIDHVSN